MNSTDTDSTPVDMDDLTASAIRLVYDYLIGAEPGDARQRFEALCASSPRSDAKMAANPETEVDILLSLDASEFVGNLDFECFQHFVSHLSGTLSQLQDTGESVPVKEETRGQRYVVTVPAALEIDGQLNVMLLGFDIREEKQIIVELLFFEPTQFKMIDKLTRS